MTEDIGRQAQATPMLAMKVGEHPAEAALPAYATPMAEHALRTCRSLIEVNRTAVDMIWDTARRQQEFAFAIAQTAFSALPGTAGHTKEFWSQATVAYGEACGHGLDAMRAFAGAALDAPLRAGAIAAGRPETTPQR